MIAQLQFYRLRRAKVADFRERCFDRISRVFNRHEFTFREFDWMDSDEPYVFYLLLWADWDEYRAAWSEVKMDEDWIVIEHAVKDGTVIRHRENEFWTRKEDDEDTKANS